MTTVRREHSLNDLFNMGLVTKFECGDPRTLYGSKSLRAVIVENKASSLSRDRTIYAHTYGEGKAISSDEYTGKPVVQDDIVFFSYNKEPRISKRYKAIEYVFNGEGKIVRGGAEVITVSERKKTTSCPICWSVVDSVYDSLESPAVAPNVGGGGHQHAEEASEMDGYAWAAYCYATNGGRVLCTKCISHGFVDEGKPKDTASYLDAIAKARGGSFGDTVELTESFTSHSILRIDRLNTSKKIGADYISKLTWKILANSDLTEEDDFVPSPTGGGGGERPPNGPVFILYADPTENSELIEDQSLWYDDAFRKFNGTGIIYIAAVIEQKGEHGPRFKPLTILPSIYSVDERPEFSTPYGEVLEHGAAGDVLELDGESIATMIERSTFIVRSGYDFQKDLGRLPLYIGNIDKYIGLSPFMLMSTYSRAVCYACHRAWRGDTMSRCSGTICKYVGRVPLYLGTSMTGALMSALTDKVCPAVVTKHADVGECTKDVDWYSFWPISRCAYSGRVFTCVNIAGKLMRPKFWVQFKGKHSELVEQGPCCAACLFKIKSYTDVVVRKLTKDEVKKVFYRVAIPNRRVYDEYMDIIFSGSECATVFPRSSAFSYDPPGDDESKIRSYLLSAQGVECALLTPYSINSDRTDVKGPLECDAWDNQFHCSYDIPVKGRPALLPKAGVVLQAKNIADMKGHLGPDSLVSDGKATDNTRFSHVGGDGVSRYVPNVQPEVLDAYDGWLSNMPLEYKKSVYSSLLSYRSAMKYVVSGTKSRPKVMIGAKLESCAQQVSLSLLSWGYNSMVATKNKLLGKSAEALYSPDRFALSRGINEEMTIVGGKDGLTKHLVQGIREAVKVSDLAKLAGDAFNYKISHESSVSILESLFDEPRVRSGFNELRGAYDEVVRRIDKMKGVEEPNVNILDSSTILVATAVRDRAGYYLADLRGRTVPRWPQLTFSELMDSCFVNVKQNDPRIRTDYSNPDFKGCTDLLDTPHFIWGHAVRTGPQVYSGGAMMSTLAQLSAAKSSGGGGESNPGSSKDMKEGIYSKCYLEWRNGLVVKFPGSKLSLRWGREMLLSSLLSVRMETTLRVDKKYAMKVLTVRPTQVNALQIMKATRYE